MNEQEVGYTEATTLFWSGGCMKMLPFHKLTQQFAKSHLLTRLFLVIGIIIISISWLMHRLEPHTFPTYFDAVWWAIVSASTVGYGDLVPDSTIGRVIAIILILFGIGFVTFFCYILGCHYRYRGNTMAPGQAFLPL
ncbi:potassium channel family protein [Thalassobacillus sp. C254]|uniref:potassium channel family protein n=1 Tax=Thalassobacillus sp. C254 TaxID=1225341 RepID=UPI0006CFAAC9|nr:potassium channel family protein [Thalassobacillus sp. C254]